MSQNKMPDGFSQILSFRISCNNDFIQQFINPNRTGLFLTCLGLGGGGGCRPLLSSLFVDLSQRNFVQGLKIKALAQIWKKIT